jgi:hypothetical protein
MPNFSYNLLKEWHSKIFIGFSWSYVRSAKKAKKNLIGIAEQRVKQKL